MVYSVPGPGFVVAPDKVEEFEKACKKMKEEKVFEKRLKEAEKFEKENRIKVEWK